MNISNEREVSEMKQGNWTFEQLEKHYYLIDTMTYKGKRYAIYESKLYGDNYQHIFVCITDKWYTYTFEFAWYTLTHLHDEYQLYKFKEGTDNAKRGMEFRTIIKAYKND